MVRRCSNRREKAAKRPAGPFAALGLDPADAGLTDDNVRAAWRRVAAATHPDRPDGGDPPRFAEAAAAYTDLRTSFGRGEARAALADDGTFRGGPRAARPALAALGARVGGGRPGRMALRILVACGAAAAGLLAAGPGPAGPALATGAATWLALTIRVDLAPPR